MAIQCLTANAKTGTFTLANPQPVQYTSCVYILASPSDIQGASNATYNYLDAAAMWGFSFSTVFMLWYLAKNLGMIINAIKRW